MRFNYLGIEPNDINFHRQFLSKAPSDGLPELTEAEENEIEYLRCRYEAMLGIIDAEEAGIDASDAASDRGTHPNWVDTLVSSDVDEFAFIQSRTSVSVRKIRAYLYCVFVEECACGLMQVPGGGLLPERELLEDVHTAFSELNL